MREGAFLLLWLLFQATASVLAWADGGFAFDAIARDLFHPLGSVAPLALHYGALLGLYALYLSFLRHPPSLRRGGFLAAACLGLLVLTPASRSTDLFAYLAHGRNTLRDLPGAYAWPVYGPAPGLHADLSRTGHLFAHGPSPYGALWTYFEAGVAWIAGNNLYLGTTLFKAIGALGLAGAAFLAGTAMGAPAGLALALNPLLLTELVGEGHNEGLVVFALAFFLASARRGRPGWLVLAASFGFYVKYLPALVAGPALRWLSRGPRRGLLVAAAAAVVAALAGIALYAPLWIGPATFAGVRDNAGAVPALVRLGPKWLRQAGGPLPIIKLCLQIGFLAAYLRWTLRTRTAVGLAGAVALTFLAYSAALTSHAWPWYYAAPIAALAFLPAEVFFRHAVPLSFLASLAGPLWAIRNRGAPPSAHFEWLHFALLGLGALVLTLALARRRPEAL